MAKKKDSNSMMRASKELLEELREIKEHKSESYEAVVKRLIKRYGRKI